MKHFGIIFIMLLCCFLCTACGCSERKVDTQQESSFDYQDIMSDSQSFFAENVGELEASVTLGVQFYQGEPIQLRAIKKSQNGEQVADIYQYKSDGSSELLMQNISWDYTFGNWYIDAEGNLYGWFNHGDIVKLDRSGKELFRKSLAEMGIEQLKGMCQLTNGSVYVTFPEGRGMISAWTLGKVDVTNGEITKVNEVRLKGMGYIGTGEQGLLYMDANGVWEINVEDGVHTKLMMFGGTSYLLKEDPEIKTFSVMDDGSVKILRCGNKYYNDVTTEVLQLTDLGDENITLILRGDNVTNSPVGKWLKEQIFQFNKENDDYHIVLEECEYGEDEEEFARQTSVQIATGQGPDIIFGDVLDDYIYGMIQKGAFVDLSVYMAQSGIKEEDFFPAAFDGWREGERIYGVNLKLTPEGYRVSEAVLGEHKVPDVETLVDALLAWQEPAIYIHYFDSQKLLEHLLQGSEDLWGMIDWEESKCNFNVELFAKILQVAKQYGYDERNNYSGVAEDRVLESLLCFDTVLDREAEDMVLSGVLFDDGCYAVIDPISSMIAINANSANVEGAWEFVSYLLAEERQATLKGSCQPVNRAAFMSRLNSEVDYWVKEELYGTVYGYEGNGYVVKYKRNVSDITEEKIAEYIKTIEEARSLPIRTVPILDIIKEEAANYFAGMKNIEEVVTVIENRVNLYLEENR